MLDLEKFPDLPDNIDIPDSLVNEFADNIQRTEALQIDIKRDMAKVVRWLLLCCLMFGVFIGFAVASKMTGGVLWWLWVINCCIVGYSWSNFFNSYRELNRFLRELTQIQSAMKQNLQTMRDHREKKSHE